MSIVVDDGSELGKVEEDDVVAIEGDEVKSDLPEKFTGKSVEEVAESYKQLEKELGRKNNEVGELRKLTDQYLQQELTKSDDPKTKNDDLEFDDLVDDPRKSIESVVNPQIEEINKKLDAQALAQRQKEFQASYPDYLEVGQSEEFTNWVQGSPYRQRQFTAATNYDFEAAGELLDTFKDQTEALRTAAEEGKKAKRAKDLQDSGTVTAGTGESSQKVWTRAELLEMRSDPVKWDAMQPEIIQAYQDGRVKT